MDHAPILLLMPAAFILIGGIIFYAGMKQRRTALRSLSWPTVQGRVISSAVESEWSHDRDTTYLVYYPVIRYEYTIGARTCTGDRTKSGGEIRTSRRGRAEKSAGRYPAGSAVTVHYDPDTPEESLLEPGVTTGVRLFILFGLVFIASGVLLMLILV